MLRDRERQAWAPDQTKTLGMAVGLGPLVIINFRGRKEYLSLVSASWKVQESQADRQNRPMTVTDKQRDTD